MGRLSIRAAICASLTALALAALPNPATAFTGAPIVETSAAVQVAGGFELKGSVNPYGLDTHYHFEYGTTTSYGAEIPMPEADAGSGSYRIAVSETITGLTADTVYHFRLVATNSGGTTDGADRSFTTSTNPYAPPPGSEPEAGQNSGGGSGPATVRVREARVGARTILTTARGRTLYSLSAEKRGRFICTKSSGCLSIWHPLLVPAGTTPKGPVKLGAIERPEGGMQATFRGRPLYRFDGDQKPGQTRGNGLKDVGAWHPATVSTQTHLATPSNV